MSHAMALHNCKQGHEWINYNNIYKTSLLNITKINMDISVDTWIHSNKITAVTNLVNLLSVCCYFVAMYPCGYREIHAYFGAVQ